MSLTTNFTVAEQSNMVDLLQGIIATLMSLEARMSTDPAIKATLYPTALRQKGTHTLRNRTMNLSRNATYAVAPPNSPQTPKLRRKPASAQKNRNEDEAEPMTPPTSPRSLSNSRKPRTPGKRGKLISPPETHNSTYRPRLLNFYDETYIAELPPTPEGSPMRIRRNAPMATSTPRKTRKRTAPLKKIGTGAKRPRRVLTKKKPGQNRFKKAAAMKKMKFDANLTIGTMVNGECVCPMPKRRVLRGKK